MITPATFAATFLQEASEQLALIEEILLELESHPTDTESVNRLFRVFHTIKGSGAMFGFDEVARFTHHVETTLDRVRSGSIAVSRELVDAILAAKDQITWLLSGSETDQEVRLQIRAQVVARLEALSSKATAPAEASIAEDPSSPAIPTATPANTVYHIQFRPEPGLLTRGVDPATLLADLRAMGPCEIAAKTDMIPPLESLQADLCFFSWDIELQTIQDLNTIKDVFIFVEEDSKILIEPVPAASDGKSALVNQEKPAATDTIPASATDVRKEKEAVDHHPTMKSPSDSTTSATPGSGSAAANAVPRADSVKVAAHKTANMDGSVRVPAEKLDRLVNLVGELVINQSRLAQVSRRLDSPELGAPIEDLERLVAELRDTVLGIRMMPIGTTFSRFKRSVRDLSTELGKEIDLVAEGAETELDKTVLDQLGDPLVHLIRNAIDHGISTPEERLREGKPRRGSIRLAARHEGANVIIEIEDDGRGLDREAIRAKAIQQDFIAEDAVLSENEIFNLIFRPGFSTAKKVTSVSGRGVGMDVVKRQIDALRGAVAIRSQVGQGTVFSLTLPLTLAIIDGLLVEVQQEQFIIPMTLVVENVELTAGQRAAGNARNLLAVRGELVPYLRLRELFAIAGDALPVERVVIVNLAGNRLGLVVDRVLGSHQTVIQSLGRFYQNVAVTSGATIMGDGRVALILDVPGLVRFADRQAPGSPRATERPIAEIQGRTGHPFDRGATGKSNAKAQLLSC